MWIDSYIVHSEHERWEVGGDVSYRVAMGMRQDTTRGEKRRKRLDVQKRVKSIRFVRTWTAECRLGYGVILRIKCEHDSVSNCRRLNEKLSTRQ